MVVFSGKDKQDQPPLAAANCAADFSVEVMKKLVIGTASGWLERLVRRVLAMTMASSVYVNAA